MEWVRVVPCVCTDSTTRSVSPPNRVHPSLSAPFVSLGLASETPPRFRGAEASHPACRGFKPLETIKNTTYGRSVTTPGNQPSRENEHFEHIPWEHLSPPGNSRRWWVYAGAAALVAAALTASLVRNANLEGPETTTQLTSTPVVSEATVTDPVASGPTTSTTAPYSEADLMAVAPPSLMAEAAGVAEWIASDYFTVDGSGAIADELSSVFPADSILPKPEQGQRSFVEWSRTLSVNEIGPGRYRVLVLVRTLGAAPGEDYQRLAPKAVTLDLAWQPQGWSLVDLPASADLPSLVQMPALPSEELPAAVVAAASAVGGTVVGGGRLGSQWRVVVEVADEAGSRWPQVFWFDEQGTRVGPPG